MLKTYCSIVILAIGRPLRVLHELVRVCDVIVILGTRVHKNRTPSDALLLRVRQGVDLYIRGLSRSGKLVLSGRGRGHAEAHVMAEIVEKLNIPKDCLVLELDSLSTVENVLNCRRIMIDNGWTSALVVTSPYHVRRATLLFRRAGVSTVGVEAFSPEVYPLGLHVKVILHEYAAWVKWSLEVFHTTIHSH